MVYLKLWKLPTPSLVSLVPAWVFQFGTAGGYLFLIVIGLFVGYFVVWRLVLSHLTELQEGIRDLTGFGENNERKRIAREKRNRRREKQAAKTAQAVAAAKSLQQGVLRTNKKKKNTLQKENIDIVYI